MTLYYEATGPRRTINGAVDGFRPTLPATEFILLTIADHIRRNVYDNPGDMEPGKWRIEVWDNARQTVAKGTAELVITSRFDVEVEE